MAVAVKRIARLDVTAVPAAEATGPAVLAMPARALRIAQLPCRLRALLHATQHRTHNIAFAATHGAGYRQGMNKIVVIKLCDTDLLTPQGWCPN